MKPELPVFSRWLEVVDLVLERVGRFPKGLRPTLGNRLIERALEIVDHLVVLRYTRERARRFQECNLSLERMRILTRITFQRKLLSVKQYEELAEAIDTCGRMLGGWRKATADSPEVSP